MKTLKNNLLEDAFQSLDKNTDTNLDIPKELQVELSKTKESDEELLQFLLSVDVVE